MSKLMGTPQETIMDLTVYICPSQDNYYILDFGRRVLVFNGRWDNEVEAKYSKWNLHFEFLNFDQFAALLFVHSKAKFLGLKRELLQKQAELRIACKRAELKAKLAMVKGAIKTAQAESLMYRALLDANTPQNNIVKWG